MSDLPPTCACYNIDMNRAVESDVFTVYAGPDSVQLKSVKLLVS
jgi:beta-glucosidase